MRISVAICTWNRSRLLARALRSLMSQRMTREDSWEVLVVNNSCTDDTDSVVGTFAGCLPVRTLSEPRPGLSNARNRALANASGEYIIWTDDDVTVCGDWLSAYVEAFRRWPNHGIFGGPIRPTFEGKPPGWLLSVWPQVETAYAIRDFGPTEQELSVEERRLPFGANYAIRTDLQRSHPYDPVLGRSPGNLFLGGEEIAVIQTIMSEGSPGRWVPKAAVNHWVPKSRQSTRYIRNYWRGQGELEATSVDLRSHPRLLGVPRWIVRVCMEQELKYRLGRLFSPPEVWIKQLKDAGHASGLLSAARARRSLPVSRERHSAV